MSEKRNMEVILARQETKLEEIKKQNEAEKERLRKQVE